MRKVALAFLAGVGLLLGLVGSADAVRPTEFREGGSIEDIDPCTGLTHTVTFAITVRVIEQNGRLVAIGDRTITTSPTGYVGHGTDTLVDNGRVLVARLADVLRSPEGDQFLARSVFVVNLTTGEIHLQDFGLTCVRNAAA